MDKKGPFGSTVAEDFEIGDIVEWSTWDTILEKWTSNIGILISIDNKVSSDRIISVATVKPINEKDNKLIELFTMNLKALTINKKNT
tara:strand:- start:63 stop:323 length:261 start_codon:yes stop_codon:yes gene_type:complete